MAEPTETPTPALSIQEMALVFLRTTQRARGNLWPPLSVEEINLLGPPTSDLGLHNRLRLLMEFVGDSLQPVTASELRPVKIPGLENAHEILPHSMERVRRETAEILRGIEIGVSLNPSPLVQYAPDMANGPVLTFLPVHIRPRWRAGWSLPGAVA